MDTTEYEKVKNYTYSEYCDYLQQKYGIGGVVNFIVPELNDVYSGWVSKQPWQQNCHNAIINDKDVYL